jgi:drug/metabolite transporter (DMT)-like permease
MAFQAARCGLGALFLLPVIFLFEKDKKQYFKNWSNPKLWKTGFFCGIALFVAAGLQQVGLVYTTAGKAGFITAMYIVLVPILGIFLHKKPPITSWIGVVLAVIGLYLLSCVGVSQVNIGDVYLLGCALGYAVQITLVDRMAEGLDGIRLNFVQVLVCCIAASISMILTEKPNAANIVACTVPLAYAGILSTGIAFSLQIIGQKHLEPTPASLIMSLESVFAVLFGWMLLNERMTKYEISGCILVFAAVILSQIPTKKTHD